ncbi:MAG: MBL fold metallo-hydrolase [Myxococcota bacterium]
MMRTVDLGQGVWAITDRSRLPGVGHLTINAFVLDGPEPLLIDTQIASAREPFLEVLRGVIDPADLRWVAITHTDADHIGNLAAVLDRAPRARLLTNYTGFIKLSTHCPVHPSRLQLVRPGERVRTGERTLTAFRPPLYDAPETMAFFDHTSAVLFAADCFGAIEPEADGEQSPLSADAWRAAMALWVAIDTPWAHSVDRDRFAEAVGAITRLQPVSIRAGHLPLGVHDVPTLTRGLLASLDGPEFRGPSHAEFLRLLER